MIGAELLKLRRRTMTKVLLFIMIGVIILINFIVLAISKAPLPVGAGGQMQGHMSDFLGLSTAIPFAYFLIANFGAVLAIILAASSMGNEYNWKTIRIALISSESRFKFLTSKLISISILILAGMLISVISGFIVGLITTGIGGYSYSLSFFTGQYALDQFAQFWSSFFVIAPYALLGFLMAIVGRSAMPGIATGIGVMFLESIITTFMLLAGGWIAKVPNYLLSANVNAITALNNLPQGFGNGGGAGNPLQATPSVPHAFITLSIYSLAFLVLAYYLFRKRDVTG
jgi:ABC-2 type transport system permease protein